MKYVCHACIEDPFLSDAVKAQATLRLCSYCHETRETVTLDTLAESIHETLQEHFYLTPNYPDEPFGYYQASEHNWDRRGDPAKYVISDIAGFNEEVAADVTRLLSDEYDSWANREEGREDPYGFDARYEEKRPDDWYFRNAWTAFRDEITFHTRFFSPSAEKILTGIFGDLTTLRTFNDESVVREINPGDEESFVWRGRAAQSDGELETILKSPARELGPPPQGLPKGGRMNVQGIPVFYGAMEQSTCVSEVRAPVGSRVVVGKFELLRSIRLLDLDALANVYVKGSFFDPNYSVQTNQAAFLKRLVAEVSRPVMPWDEAFEYLPTQAVAEYLANKSCPRLDGIIFRSSQTGGTGRNLVLFNHACSVQPYELPPGTEVEVSIDPIYQDDEEDQNDEVVVFETVPSNEPDEKRQTKPEERQRGHSPLFMRKNQGLPEPHGDPTLQLDQESIEVLHIEGITYTSRSRTVSRHRQTNEERDAFSWDITDADFDTLLDMEVEEESEGKR